LIASHYDKETDRSVARKTWYDSATACWRDWLNPGDRSPLGNRPAHTPGRILESAETVRAENQKPTKAAMTVEYKGFLINISTRQQADGWSVSAEIEDPRRGMVIAGKTKDRFKTESEAKLAAEAWGKEEIDNREQNDLK
jgi:hypothetical protein